MLKLIAVGLGIVLVLLKWKYSKRKRQKDIEKGAAKDIRKTDGAIMEGDTDRVAGRFAELRNRILRATSSVHGRGRDNKD